MHKIIYINQFIQYAKRDLTDPLGCGFEISVVKSSSKIIMSKQWCHAHEAHLLYLNSEGEDGLKNVFDWIQDRRIEEDFSLRYDVPPKLSHREENPGDEANQTILTIRRNLSEAQINRLEKLLNT